jgi:hypothetical protein
MRGREVTQIRKRLTFYEAAPGWKENCRAGKNVSTGTGLSSSGDKPPGCAAATVFWMQRRHGMRIAAGEAGPLKSEGVRVVKVRVSRPEKSLYP